MELIKNNGKRIKTRGPHLVHEGGGRACPLGVPPCLVAPLVLHRPQLQLYIFTFGEKKTREKDSSCFMIWSRRQALISLGRADLESVRGSGEGNPSPSHSDKRSETSGIERNQPETRSNRVSGRGRGQPTPPSAVTDRT